MASLLELTQLKQQDGFDDLAAKVRAAAIKKAVSIVGEASPPQGRLDWAESTLQSPDEAGQDILWFAIGANAGLTPQEILNAADAGIETAVGNAVDTFYPSA